MVNKKLLSLLSKHCNLYSRTNVAYFMCCMYVSIELEQFSLAQEVEEMV